MNAEAPRLPRQVGAHKRQQSQSHKFSTAYDWYKSQFFKIFDYAITGLQSRVTGKCIPVLVATESVLSAGWNGDSINSDDLSQISKHYGDEIDTFRLEQQLCCLQNMRKQIPEADKNIPVSKIIEHIGTNHLNVSLLTEYFF